MSFIRRNVLIFLTLVSISALPLLADRTTFRAGPNLFTVQQDVEIGRYLAGDAESAIAKSRDSFAQGYITALGNQLAVYAPGYDYPYQFFVVNDSSIDTFVLPGGIIYVTSGLVRAAKTEPQLAGLLAHQIAHVALRHGSQKISREYTALVPNAARGRVPVRTAMTRLNVDFHRDSMILAHTVDEERQADLMGAQILYDAGFDPREMPAFFQALATEHRNLSSELFSAHPGFSNRAAGVRRELQNMGGLRADLRGDSPDLRTTQDRLRSDTGVGVGRPGTPASPSSRLVTYRGYDFELQHPENWRVTENADSVSIAPDSGFVSGSLAYGMMFGTFEPESGSYFGQTPLNVPGTSAGRTSLSQATDQLIEQLRQSNPALREVRSDQRRRVDGETAMTIELTNDSPVGDQEVNWLVTVLRPDGLLHYFVGVAPEDDFNRYLPTFERIVGSVRFYD
jgi:hypothetical protein